MSAARPRAVFLDRDGVLNVRPAEHDYVRSPEAFRWLPGVLDALAALARDGRPLVVVSNQRGISRGLVTRSTLTAIERRIQEELRPHGAQIAGFYYCPHGAEDGCPCRKPAPGLLLQAAAELALDLPASAVVGDSESDVEAGRACGCLTVRIGENGVRTAADLLVPSLRAAVPALLWPACRRE